MVIDFFITLLAWRLNVASPPLKAALASVTTFVFFLDFFNNSNVTSPVGTFAPGAASDLDGQTNRCLAD